MLGAGLLGIGGGMEVGMLMVKAGGAGEAGGEVDLLAR